MSARNLDHLYEKPQAAQAKRESLRFFVQDENGCLCCSWAFMMFSAKLPTHGKYL
jgi:hypothetical protein